MNWTNILQVPLKQSRSGKLPIAKTINFGYRGGLVVDGMPADSSCWLCEGSWFSQSAHRVWSLNAVAGLHDTFQVFSHNDFVRSVFNYPGMPVAALVTYGGFLGRELNSTRYVPYPFGGVDGNSRRRKGSMHVNR